MPQHRLIVNLLILFTVVGVASLVFAQTHGYKGKRVRSVSINNSDEASSDSCAESMRIYSDDYADTQYSEETEVLANQPTKITASPNGGIQLGPRWPWARSAVPSWPLAGMGACMWLGMVSHPKKVNT